ncbi:MAG: phosphodiester glycosidase family protein [Oscillospiraceae bacterium]|nr:phosphodiester glycosidase family protein [Oscillospiraceae bacterium]
MENTSPPFRSSPAARALRYLLRLLLVLLTGLLALVLALVIALGTIVHGPSQTARDLFVTTVLESGQLKFVASLFLSDEEISDIVSRTSIEQMDTKIDSGLIQVSDGDAQESGQQYDENGIEIVEISGSTYYAKLMIVQDPSKIKLATTYPWTEYGENLDALVESSGAVAGVNGGLYVSDSNKGGSPLGVAVSEGQILYNQPSGWAGLYMIGFDQENILQIVDIEGMTSTQLEALIEEMGIRDAVAFQDEASDANNHFVPLVINGEARQLNGQGSGANPRTAIGQRADGSVLLLVTDGRGASGHLGATASDLINIMLEYGAVNAANLDGGSSSCMYYNGSYEMTSVTLYYANSSWRLPTAFVVEGG